MEKADLLEILYVLEQGEYGIGIHGIDKGSIEEKKNRAESIINQGLKINNNSKTILSTSISLGINDYNQRISQEIMGYQFGNGAKVNVVIAVPLHIQSETGKKIFFGFPEQNKRTSGQQYEEHCILDRICSRLRNLPSQFILGYYCENPDGSESFVKNRQHYSNLTIDKKEDFFNEIFSKMDSICKGYNDLIANGNIERLNQIKEKMSEMGWTSFIVEDSILLAQKYKNPNISQKNIRDDRDDLDY